MVKFWSIGAQNCFVQRKDLVKSTLYIINILKYFLKFFLIIPTIDILNTIHSNVLMNISNIIRFKVNYLLKAF